MGAFEPDRVANFHINFTFHNNRSRGFLLRGDDLYFAQHKR